jgi:hypothetical protein
MAFERLRVCFALVLALVDYLGAQTRVDLRTQGKSVDFSGAISTKPSQTGAILPAACSVGQTFLNTAAQPGQNLFVCTAPNTWTSQGSAGLANYSAQFSQANTLTIPGSTHKLGTENLTVAVYDNRTPAWLVEPDYILINPTTYDVTINFASPQSGTVILSAGGGGGGGAVSSVFGRVGSVTPQAGDYSFPQISGTVAGAQLPAAGGDLAGSLANATVAGLRNRPVSNAAPAAGQALTWNGTTGQWEPQTPSGGGGAGMAAQLGDYLVTRSSNTVLALGANCSSSTPCNVRIGAVVYSISLGATVTLSGGTGTAYVYIDFGGNLTVGHNLTLTCSAGCTAISGVTGFPVNSIPLFVWAATNNAWNASGTDLRAFLSAKALVAGPGVVTVESGSQTQVAVDSAAVPTFLTTTTTLGFGPLAAGGCGELTFSLPGANVGDAVEPGWPSGIEAGLIGTMRVSAPNTIAVRLCNLSGSVVTPASASYRATIVRSF